MRGLDPKVTISTFVGSCCFVVVICNYSQSNIVLLVMYSQDIDQLLCVKGMVTRCSSVIPDLKQAYFRCFVCSHSLGKLEPCLVISLACESQIRESFCSAHIHSISDDRGQLTKLSINMTMYLTCSKSYIVILNCSIT